MSLPISVVILTKDEKIHIRRCLEKLQPLTPERIIVVDSFSTDGTQGIAQEMGAEVVEHIWPGNQALQFNWAIDNLSITSEWILRIDADEYLTDELIEELRTLLPALPDDTTALVFSLGRAFMGRVLKHGIVNGVCMVRMFRRGYARYENRIMDEHLMILSGKIHTCRNKFIDDNMMPLSFFISKHNNYANREAALSLYSEINSTLSKNSGKLAKQVEKKRSSKDLYARLPLFWRSFGYFLYRYIIKLGFLDGKEGFLWDFLQGLWYRILVDAKILEIKRRSGNNPDKIRKILKHEYGIDS